MGGQQTKQVGALGQARKPGPIVGIEPTIERPLAEALEEGVRVSRGTVHGRCGVFVADGVGQVPTDTGGDELKAIGGAGGEARREPAEERTHVVRPGP